MIDRRFRYFTEIEYDRNLKWSPDGIVRAIAPIHFVENIGCRVATLACACDVFKDSKNGYWLVRMNRNVCWEKDMGRYGEHEWTCYTTLPELYSMDCLSLEWQLALAIGYTIDMETIEKHDPFYTLKYTDIEEKKKLGNVLQEEIFS